MKNYDFEARQMTLPERKALEDGRLNPWKTGKYAFITLCVFALSSYIFNGGLPQKSDFPFIWGLLSFIVVAFAFISYVNKQIKMDLEGNCVYIAYAKLEDIMTSEDEDNVGFNHVFDYEKKYLHFQFSPKTLIHTKHFGKPIIFKNADKAKLQLALGRNQIYKLTFALNTEYLFSMEEIE